MAELEGGIIGIASSGPPRDTDATWPVELFVLYLLAIHHGGGTGRALLDAVTGGEPAALWVADPNPRAQAFYYQSGFRPSAAKDDGIAEIRMVREHRFSTQQATGHCTRPRDRGLQVSGRRLDNWTGLGSSHGSGTA